MNNINVLRAMNKLTQSHLAQATGVSLSTIKAYENETRPPKADWLKRVAELYGVSIDWLLARGSS